jgi:hypothetical protein
VAVEFTALRGLKLYRLRNVNAPLPETGVRANPDLININQFESSGMLQGTSVRVMFQAELGRNLELLSQYTHSRTTDDTGGLFALPADNFDLRGERGRSDFDRRHRFNFVGMLRLPLDTRFGTIVSLSSGIPFNLTTGFDENQDTVANDRPPGIDRNAGRGPGFANVDLRLSKEFELTKRNNRGSKLELQLDVFNVFNRVNFVNFIGTLSSPFFGRANGAHLARQVQISLRFNF